MFTTGSVKNIADEDIRSESQLVVSNPANEIREVPGRIAAARKDLARRFDQHVVEKPVTGSVVPKSPKKYFRTSWFWIKERYASLASSVQAQVQRCMCVVQVAAPSNVWMSEPIHPGINSVAPGIADKYKRLFVNRLSYCVQSEHDFRVYVRPRHDDLVQISRQKAAAEKLRLKAGVQQQLGREDEIYDALISEFNLPSPYLGLTEETIGNHLAGKETINLFSINPINQRCKWIMFDADYDKDAAKRDLTILRLELSNKNIFAVFEEAQRGGRLWIFCAEPLPARQCRLFAQNLALRTGTPIKAPGFDVKGVEIFPKQDSVKPRELGDAVRAPLGVAHRNSKLHYWFSGDFAAPILEAQIEALCTLPKMTANQLDDLGRGMQPSRHWEPAKQ